MSMSTDQKAIGDGRSSVSDEQRKRKKVSRACDNCRRKKAKCDLAEDRCYNCERSGEECSFSRVPLRRGPVRGSLRDSTRSSLPIAGNESPLSASQSLPPMPASSVRSWQEEEWQDVAIDRYYLLIHPTYPLLPREKTSFKYELEDVHSNLRSALLHAINSIVHCNSAVPASQCSLAVAQLIQYNKSCRPFAQNRLANHLAHMQVLILLAIEADNRGPDKFSAVIEYSQATLMGTAVGIAYMLKLHYYREELYWHATEMEATCKRRLWFILVILDRWHAVATSSPSFIPDNYVKFENGDTDELGPITSHLVRLSNIIGHLGGILASSEALFSETNSFLFKLISEELDQFRMSAELVWCQSNLLHLAFWHVTLLSNLYNPAPDPYTLLGAALRIASILPNSATPVTPLNHHFFGLAVSVLGYLVGGEITRLEARRGLSLVKEAVEKYKGLLMDSDTSKLPISCPLLMTADWDAAVLALIREKMADSTDMDRMLLDEYGDDTLRRMRRYGYLGSLNMV